MKKLLIIILAILMCLASFAGCGGGGGNVTLTVWCSALDKDMIKKMTDEFMATNPGIGGVDVVVVEDDKARLVMKSFYEPEDAFTDEELEELKSIKPEKAADIICIPHDQLGALATGGYLLEITDSKYIEAINSNNAPSVKAGQIGGIQYGFPSSFETHMLFYNKSIISDEAAMSLEEILKSEIPADGYSFAMDFSNAYFTVDWFFTYGCMLFGENGEDASLCDFDSDGGIAAMTYLIENNDKFGNFGDKEAAKLFAEHKLGAYIGGPWNAAEMTAALKGNYGCEMLPSIDGKAMRSFAGYKLYCVNTKAANKAASFDLAAFLTNPGNQKTRFLTRNLIPVANSLATDADVAVSTTANAVIGQGPNAIAMPSIPEMSNFWSPTGGFTLACHAGEIEIAELPDKLKDLVAEITGGIND